MIIDLVDHLLSIAIPKQRRHIVGCRSQNVGMERRKANFLDSKLMACEHHDWHICCRAQVPNFHGVVCRPGCDKVLVLVEVHRQHFVRVRVNFFDIFAGPQVPNASGLVAAAAAEDALVCRVPEGLVDSELVRELGNRS